MSGRRRPRVRLEVVGQLGPKPCHRGHRVGQAFDVDTQRGRLCPMAEHVAFPYVDILRYGGAIPGEEPGTCRFCCPDADVALVFRAQVVEEEDA